MKHFLKFSDFSKDEFDHIIERTTVLKKRFKQYIPYQPLTDRMLAMVFEKSSTRTRVSFEAGIYQLGGQAINLDSQSTQLGRAEPIEDTARVRTGDQWPHQRISSLPSVGGRVYVYRAPQFNCRQNGGVDW